MILNLKLVKVDVDYCDYLRQFDYRVVYNKNSKELRPFVGVLFTIRNMEYFAPLSSPKIKHLKMKNTIDFYKLDGGKLGAINFNNMIPVRKENYKLIDFDKKTSNIEELKYNNLLKEQLLWLNKYEDEILSKSYKLYYLYLNNRLTPNIKNRCCNFPLLEEKCFEYKKELVNN